jgi:hypothetical protein
MHRQTHRQTKEKTMRCKLSILLSLLVLGVAVPAAAAPLVDEPLSIRDVMAHAVSSKVDHEQAIRDLAPAWVSRPAATHHVGVYVEEISVAVAAHRLDEATGLSLILGLAAAAESGADLRAPDSDLMGLLAGWPMPRGLAERVDGAIILHRLGGDEVHPLLGGDEVHPLLGGDEAHPFTELMEELLGFMDMTNPISELRDVIGAYANLLDTRRPDLASEPLRFAEVKDLILSFQEVSGLNVELGRSGGFGVMPGDNVKIDLARSADDTLTLDDLLYVTWLQSELGIALDNWLTGTDRQFAVEISGVSAGYAWADLDRFVHQKIDSAYLPRSLTDLRPALVQFFDEADALFGGYGLAR